MKLSSTMERYLCLDFYWIGQYVFNELRAVLYRCIATFQIKKKLSCKESL